MTTSVFSNSRVASGIRRLQVLVLVGSALLMSGRLRAEPPETGRYSLSASVKTRMGEGRQDPLPGVSLTISGPEGATQGRIEGHPLTTDADGRAVLDLALPGIYTVVANHPDYEPSTHTIDVANPGFKTYLQLTLRRKDVVTQYKLIVKVMNNEGNPVPRAEVEVTGPAEATRLTNQDGIAEFTLPFRGNYRINVAHPNFGEVDRPFSFTEPGQTVTESFYFGPKYSTMQIIVDARDEGGHPIVGASAEVDTFPTQRMTTDANGGCTFEVTHNERTNVKDEAFVVRIAHPDYVSESLPIKPIRGGINRTYPAPFQLKRKAGNKQVLVTVFEKGTHQPLMDATVNLDSRSQMRDAEHLVANTSGNGEASFSVFHEATMDVTVSRGGYETAKTSVEITDSSGPYPFEVELAPKPGSDLRRMLKISVRGKNKAGKFVWIRDAAVTLSTGQSGVTNASGHLNILHREAPGESISVTVVPTGNEFKRTTETVLVRARGTLFDAEKIQNEEVKTRLQNERRRLIKEGGDVNVTDRVLDALSSSASKEFMDLFAAAFEQSFGPQAVDSISITCDRAAVKLDGDVIPGKGAVKLNEKVKVQIALIYTGSDVQNLEVNEVVELMGPDGKLVTNNVSNRTLKLDEYNRRYMDIVCAEAGTFTVKSTVKGPDGLEWTDQASFVVEKGATGGKPGKGVFKLVDKVVGKAAPPDKQPYGTWSGSIGESSVTANYETTTSYDAHAALTAQWSTPPAQIAPGDTIELTVTATASVTGKDHGNNSIEAFWYADGSASVVEGQHAFAGIASSGKLIASGQGKFKIKVGESGGFRIYSAHNATWGSGGVWHPCEYNYVFEADAAPAATPPGGGKTTLTPVGQSTEEKKKGAEGNYATSMDMKTLGHCNVGLAVTASSTPGQDTVLGEFSRETGSGLKTCNISGTVFLKDGRLAAKGFDFKTADGKTFAEGDLFMTLDAKFMSDTGDYRGMLTIKIEGATFSSPFILNTGP